MKSHCCKTEIEILKAGEGMFSPVGGAYICSNCGKYCCESREEIREDHKEIIKKMNELKTMENTENKTSSVAGAPTQPNKDYLVEANREKHWDELTDGEKIERLRTLLHRAFDQIDKLQTANSRITNKFQNHEHLNGKIMIPHNTIIPSDYLPRLLSENSKEAYF